MWLHKYIEIFYFPSELETQKFIVWVEVCVDTLKDKQNKTKSPIKLQMTLTYLY